MKRHAPRVFRADWCRRATVFLYREHYHIVVDSAVYCVNGAAAAEAKLLELGRRR